MKKTYLINFVCIGLMSSTLAFASSAASVPATDNNTLKWINSNSVKSLAPALLTLRAKDAPPVIFPQTLPANTYYASTETTRTGYSVSLDASQDCHGAKYCMLINLTAAKFANPQIYYDRDNKEMTTRVLLPQGPAYYTQSFALGDTWPANISWRSKSTLYTLSLNLPLSNQEAKVILIQMATSATSVQPSSK